MDTIDKQNVVAMTEAGHWPTPADLADAAQEMEVELTKAEAQEDARLRVYRYRDLLECSLKVVDGPHKDAYSASQAMNVLATHARMVSDALNELERIEAGGAK